MTATERPRDLMAELKKSLAEARADAVVARAEQLSPDRRTDPVPLRRVFLVVHPRGGPPWAGTDEARAHEFARNTGQVVAELAVAADYSTEDTR